MHESEQLKESLRALGQGKMPHIDNSLISHMTAVYRMLLDMNCPEGVAVAGLFHGVYGTHALNGSKAFLIDEAHRLAIRSIIGEHSERLVYVFCVMTYESLGKSFRNLLRGNNTEIWNRCTNVPIYLSDDEFVELLWLKFADLLAQPEHWDRGVHGPFWELVAEFLGPHAGQAWQRVFSGSPHPCHPTP